MVKKILIVDDDEDFQLIIRKRLESFGFFCESAFTVEEALEKLKETEPRLIILDIRFANTDGTAFLKNAKKWLPKGRNLPPIIVLSGYNEKEIVDYVLDLGAAGFLKKPFDSDTLVSMVKDYMLR